MESVEENLKGKELDKEDSLSLPDTKIPTPDVIMRSRKVNRRVTLNVGGVR